MQAVLDAARNVACAGGEPLALTDCLNFGNPEKPEIGWELAQAIEGIAQAADALGVPAETLTVGARTDRGVHAAANVVSVRAPRMRTMRRRR